MKLFSPIFSLLKKQKNQKSAYIRNLLNEYTSLRTDEREYLCYVNEYEEIMQAALDKLVIEYVENEKKETFFPITVDLCCYDNEYYVIGLIPQNKDFILKSYRLCEFKSYKIQAFTYEIPEAILSKTDKIINDFEYYETPSFYLEGATK